MEEADGLGLSAGEISVEVAADSAVARRRSWGGEPADTAVLAILDRCAGQEKKYLGMSREKILEE